VHKTWYVLILFGILSVLLILNIIAYKDDDSAEQQALSAAMLATDVQIEKTNVYGWGKLPQTEENKQSLENLVQSAMNQLNVNREAYQMIYSENADRNIVRGVYQSRDINIVVAAQTLSQIKNHGTYLVINVEKLKSEPEKTVLLKQKMKDIFQNTGSSAHISTCLVGRLDGKLEQDAFTARIERAFREINADVVGQMKLMNLTSTSGFSPLIPNSLTVDGQKINVSMAIRYNSYEDRTYITIGSPVITGEY
jgi:type II secretory pathway pseudopilin PulG